MNALISFLSYKNIIVIYLLSRSALISFVFLCASYCDLSSSDSSTCDLSLKNACYSRFSLSSLFGIDYSYIASGKRGSGTLASLVFLVSNSLKDETKNELTVLKLKLNQEIKEAITLEKGVSFCFASCP